MPPHGGITAGGVVAAAGVRPHGPPLTRLQGLPPVIDARTRCLILGSFPGQRSLALRQYYGHPSNHFWPLLSCALVEPLVHLPYRDRLARLTERGLGLWDVVGACERQGSLDAAIRRPVGNDLSHLRQLAPHLQAVIFNGGAAARYRAAVAGGGYRVDVLPSSSAAHAGCGFEEKLTAWRAAIRPQVYQWRGDQ